MIPWFQFTTFFLGPIPIQVWGLFVASGVGLSSYIVWRTAKQYDLNADKLLDAVVWMMMLGVLGARLSHIVLYEPAFFLAHPVEVFKIWHGGLSSFGGIIGALVGFFWYVHKERLSQKAVLVSADVLSYGALFGWLVGRIGCVMIHDHLGQTCDGCFLSIQMPVGPARFDMALLEILALLPLLVFFILYKKHKKPFDGQVTGILFVYYGIARFILDFWRASADFVTGDVRYLGLTPGQYFAIVLALFGSFLLLKRKNGEVA